MTLPTKLSRQIGDDVIAAYEQDGAAVVRDVVPTEWIDLMRDAIERILGDPGTASVEYDDRPGTFVENQKVMALLPGFEMKDGDRFVAPHFPQAWPRP